MNEEQSTEKAVKGKKGKLTSKHWTISGIVATLVVIAGALIFFWGDSSAEKLQEQLDLGQKYLEEMNYEEAVVAFEAAIEIDPMSVDAYLGLVEVYIRTGDFDTALEYAKKGYEMTGDERLKEKIAMIVSGNITASNGWRMRVSYYDANGTLCSYLVYQRGEHGREERVSLYYADGSLVDEVDVQYNENGDETVGVTIECKTGGVAYALLKTESEYDTDGHIIVKRNYHADGTLYEYSEYEYDTDGNAIVHKYYSADGILYEYSKYEYDTDGHIIVRRDYSADGTFVNYFEYEYDTDGHRIAERFYDADGTLQECIKSEYDSNGNYIAERHYDGNGNLASETRYD